jgi:MFS transporter, OCT family, solute carrier family 22 (organic cation transporter), member 4/5
MSTVARLGAMVAPFVPLLVSLRSFNNCAYNLHLFKTCTDLQSRYYEPLPLFLFGAVSFIGGLLALYLPETFRRKLPETVNRQTFISEFFDVIDFLSHFIIRSKKL